MKVTIELNCSEEDFQNTYQKKLNELEIKRIKNIENYKLQQKFYDIVRNLVIKFEGKQITKRFETALKHLLPDYIVHLDKDFCPKIRIWGKDISYNESIDFYLGGYKSEFFSIVKFDESKKDFVGWIKREEERNLVEEAKAQTIDFFYR